MPSLTRIRYEQKLQFFLDWNSDTELTIISRREWSGWAVSLFDFRTLRTEFCSDLRKQQSLKGYKLNITLDFQVAWKFLELHIIPEKLFFSMELDYEQALILKLLHA